MIDWKDKWTGWTVDEMWTDFMDILRNLVSLHVPLKDETKRRKSTFTKQTRKMTKKRSNAWQKYCQNRSGRNFNMYKKIRNEVNYAIRKEEDLNRKRILRGFNRSPKRFYGYIRNMQAVKDNLTSLRKDDGELTTNDQETAHLLSTYFKEVYTVEDLSNIPVATEQHFNWNDADLHFDEETVMKVLQKLNPDKSPGPVMSIRWYLRNVLTFWQNH